MGYTQWTESEKQLLTVIGSSPDSSMKQLLTQVNYKWESTLVKKLDQFRKQAILWGPVYDVNYSKLCKNPLHKSFCIFELSNRWETVLPYLVSIESYAWIFPVLSPHREFFIMGFYSSDDHKMEALFQLLKDNNIITDYMIRTYTSKRVIENPNLHGNPTPSMDHVLECCAVPDMSLPHHDTNWNECDISIIPYLSRSDTGGKLIEILKKERKLDRTWTYSQLHYSCKKMVEKGLIEKKYFVLPFHIDQCTYFFLSVKTHDVSVTQRILCNFARGERVYKEYLLCGERGLLFCISHTSFLTELMHELDQIEEVTEKELYLLRSNWRSCPISSPPDLTHYDTETQTLEYPYHIYEEEIKKNLEKGIPADWNLEEHL
jgi:hypothetical protein